MASVLAVVGDGYGAWLGDEGDDVDAGCGGVVAVVADGDVVAVVVVVSRGVGMTTAVWWRWCGGWPEMAEGGARYLERECVCGGVVGVVADGDDVAVVVVVSRWVGMASAVKDKQEKDKIGSKPDKNEKRPFKIGKFRETLAEGALHLGPEHNRVFADLTLEEKDKYKADIRATNIILQSLPKDIYTLINHYTDAKDIWDNMKMLLEGSELTKDECESQLYDDFEHFCQNKGTNTRFSTQKDHVLQDDQCDAFNLDVDEAPTAQTMFMENLSLADQIYDEAGPSYESGILSEVQDHDNYLDNVDEYHEVHEMQNEVQPNYVVDFDAEYTSDGNIIVYDQYVKNNAEQVVQIQSALYNGHEIVKTNHGPAVVHDSNDTLKIAEITRKKKLEKMKTHLWIKGIQTALIKEVKEMKEIFEQMEAEVNQNDVDKKSAKIERKNLLIENENLIVDCLSNELLNGVMNAMNTVSRFPAMHDAYTVEQARCLELEARISKLKHKIKKDDHSEMIKYRILDIKALDSQNIELTKKVTALQEQNELFRTENVKIKQHYKDLYDFIKITHAKTIEKTTSLLTENEKLMAQLKGKMKFVTMDTVKPKVLALGMYAIDVEPIPSHNRNNREVHLDYLKHLKKSVETLWEIVKEARIEKPLDNAFESAYFYTKLSQKLLEYIIGTCMKEFSKKDKKVTITPLTRKKQVTFKETCETSNKNKQAHVEHPKVQKTNILVIPSTGVNRSTEDSESNPRSNTKKTRILPAKSDNKKKV
nr:hypothetical protein [Tanacetum cinerariifolium]